MRSINALHYFYFKIELFQYFYVVSLDFFRIRFFLIHTNMDFFNFLLFTLFIISYIGKFIKNFVSFVPLFT